MTKEEKIKEAYGDIWDKIKENVDENGFVQFKVIAHGVTNKMHYEWDFGLDYLSVETTGYSPDIKWRPKSLQGIEHNNGWTKIESEDDLPKESWNYWIMQSDGLVQTMKEYDDNKKYYNIKASHYQPIVKPKPPIY